MYGFSSHRFIYTLPVVIDELGYSATNAVSQQIDAAGNPLLTGNSATSHHPGVYCSGNSHSHLGIFF